MKPRKISEVIRAKERIERGEAVPARVWDVRPDGRSGFTHRAVAPRVLQRAQKRAWDKGIVATRQKLGLSQPQFAEMLGISVRPLHHWEQRMRTPSGAAPVLLCVAAFDPQTLLKAAA